MDRLKALDLPIMPPTEIVLELGSREEWLATALVHLKATKPEFEAEGRTTVSTGALDIVIGKVEELLFGGQPWPWPEEPA